MATPDTSRAAVERLLIDADPVWYPNRYHELAAVVRALLDEREALAKAISPAKCEVWDTAHLAQLAECHREDSETLDNTGDGTDYEDARMAIRAKHEARETALRAVLYADEGYGLRRCRSCGRGWSVEGPFASGPQHSTPCLGEKLDAALAEQQR